MPKREFEGKSVKKAVANACRELNLNAASLKYKIIKHGSTGIFGLVGSRKAKILVSLPSNEKETKPCEGSGERSDTPVSTPNLTPSDEAAKTPDPPAPETVSDSTVIPTNSPDSKSEENNNIDEAVEVGRSFVQHLVDAVTDDATVSSTRKNKKITYDISGGNAALLIGKHGQTLEAFQFLTERAVNRTRDKRLLVEVDVAGYQAKRRGNLVDQAKRMADKANHNSRPVTIGPLSPQDRRVIHMTLKPDPRVRTQSNGKGIIRKLTIYPKKRGKRPPRNGKST